MFVSGLLVSGGGTPLEPCRVAPYVSVPRLSAVPRAPAPPLPPLAPHPPPSTAFAPFDSALLSAAAHQVIPTAVFSKAVVSLEGFKTCPISITGFKETSLLKTNIELDIQYPLQFIRGNKIFLADLMV